MWLFDGTKGGDITKNTGGLVSSSASYISVSAEQIQFTTVKNPSSNNIQTTLITTNKIDFSKINTLNVRRTRNSGWGGASSSYGIPTLQVWDGSKVIASVALGADYADTVVSLDVSSVTGDAYVRLYLDNPKNVSQMTWTYVTQIWGE